MIHHDHYDIIMVYIYLSIYIYMETEIIWFYDHTWSWMKVPMDFSHPGHWHWIWIEFNLFLAVTVTGGFSDCLVPLGSQVVRKDGHTAIAVLRAIFLPVISESRTFFVGSFISSPTANHLEIIHSGGSLGGDLSESLILMCTTGYIVWLFFFLKLVEACPHAGTNGLKFASKIT